MLGRGMLSTLGTIEWQADIRACDITGLLSPRQSPSIRCVIARPPGHNLAIQAPYTLSEEHATSADTLFRRIQPFGEDKREGLATFCFARHSVIRGHGSTGPVGSPSTHCDVGKPTHAKRHLNESGNSHILHCAFGRSPEARSFACALLAALWETGLFFPL